MTVLLYLFMSKFIFFNLLSLEEPICFNYEHDKCISNLTVNEFF